jgi:thiamine transporter
MPLGGSVTLVSMLPIIIIGLRHGPVWGLCSGLVYSLLQFFQQPYFLTPFQFLLDYIFAFTALGLSGFFKGRKFGFYIGTVIGIGVRFICSFLSGAIFYGMYAADYGFASPYTYSLAYNGGYLLPELIVTLVIGTILIKIPRLKLLG